MFSSITAKAFRYASTLALFALVLKLIVFLDSAIESLTVATIARLFAGAGDRMLVHDYLLASSGSPASLFICTSAFWHARWLVRRSPLSSSEATTQ